MVLKVNQTLVIEMNIKLNSVLLVSLCFCCLLKRGIRGELTLVKLVCTLQKRNREVAGWVNSNLMLNKWLCVSVWQKLPERIKT